MKFLIIILFGLIANNSYAQKSEKDYADVDAYAKTLGNLANFNVAIIADTLTRKFNDKEQKARAIFYWIANNIDMDPKAIRSNDTKKNDPVIVIQTRKATSLGFAMLIQEMCSMANIRCLTVDGYTRNNTEDINNVPDELNHSWNVVQLGQSPEDWYYIDAAKASGFLDKKQTTFTRRFTGRYFFTDKALFNQDHYADNSAWQLGDGPKSLKDFYALPVISGQAYAMGLKKINPATGYFKTKLSSKIKFSFKYDGSYETKKLELVVGEDNKKPTRETIDFNDDGVQISFSYQFKKDDLFPVKIVIDGETAVMFMVEVTE